MDDMDVEGLSCPNRQREVMDAASLDSHYVPHDILGCPSSLLDSVGLPEPDRASPQIVGQSR